MIEGQFDEEGKLFFEIGLVAPDGETILTDALLDTGFTGWLAINTQDLDFGWPLVKGKERMKTAQGEADFKVYAGTVQIDGREFNIPVLGGDGISEVILGLPWLKTRRLLVDFPAGILTLG